ncbi:MAG TPA: hypothetical protein VFO23_01275 [Steroidobacteraceae bacterium]|nr:hypothetical protein [Steroidobacteraceae bacterium]
MWIALATSGCVMTTPAPGADQVKITNNASDVAACTPAGNIRVPRNSDGLVDIANAQTQFRNETVGLGGNVALVTEGALGVPAAGIAYRCP